MLTALEATVVSALLVLLVGAVLTVADRGAVATDRASSAAAGSARAETSARPASARATCSAHGFDPTSVASSALVQTPAGKVRMVSFARGWEVYQGRRPGTLVAVCVGDES